MFRRRISSGLISCFSLPSFTHEHVFQCKLFFHNVSQRMQAWWVSCPLPCLYPQQPGPHCLCIQGGSLQKVYSLGGEHFMGAFSLGIQYNTGCQLSLISQSALQTLPTSMYSQGTFSRVGVMTYAGVGKMILTSEVKLKLHGKMLKLLTIEEDLNNGSGFSFPVPSKWRLLTGTSPLYHFILLGEDNHLFFPLKWK